jgi:hypothetical protein
MAGRWRQSHTMYSVNPQTSPDVAVAVVVAAISASTSAAESGRCKQAKKSSAKTRNNGATHLHNAFHAVRASGPRQQCGLHDASRGVWATMW